MGELCYWEFISYYAFQVGMVKKSSHEIAFLPKEDKHEWAIEEPLGIISIFFKDEGEDPYKRIRNIGDYLEIVSIWKHKRYVFHIRWKLSPCMG